jgi:hypothetical protein
MCRLHRLFRHGLALTLLFPILLSPVAKAALTIDIFPSGNDVLMTATGSANTEGLTTTSAGATLLILLNGHISVSPIQSSITAANQRISCLGLTPGTHVWTRGSGPTSDSLTITMLTASPLVVTTTMKGIVENR